MTVPVDHAILDDIDIALTSCIDDEFIHFKQWTRQSECIEFQDEKGEWFEIIVRPIERP